MRKQIPSRYSQRTEAESPILTLFLRGGLGNQLLQFAHAREVARFHNLQLQLSTALLPQTMDSFREVSRWPFALGQLPELNCELDARFHQPPGRTSLLSKLITSAEILSGRYPDLCSYLGVVRANSFGAGKLIRKHSWIVNLELNGKLGIASAKFVSSRLSRLTDPSESYSRLKVQLEALRPNIIHLRAGDFDNLVHQYGSLGRGYWSQVMSRIDKSRPTVVFTNAKSASRRLAELRLPDEWVIGDDSELSPLETLSLMTLGESFAGSNSTLSWWAAVLTRENRPVILPHMTARHSVALLGGKSEWTWIPHN